MVRPGRTSASSVEPAHDVVRRAAPGSSGTTRHALLSAVAALAAFACLGGQARALDVVRLRNGRSLEGKVTEETTKHIILEYEGGLLRIRRADIFMIEKDRPLAEWEARMRERARREAEALAKAVLAEFEGTQPGPARAGKADKRLLEGRQGLERRETERLKRLVEDMAAPDPETRTSARQIIEREGRKAVPVLSEALFHKSAFARTAAAEILGSLRARESVRDMIVALRAAVPDSVKVRHWQRRFVRALREGLRGITGRNFGLNPRGAGEDKAVAKWVEWWDGKPPTKGAGDDESPAVPRGAYADWDTPQHGETELDEEAPEYAEKLWEARRVGDRRHSYSPPAGDGASGL